MLPAFVASAALLSADDWPRFRGPNGSGVAESPGLPTKISARANVVWKVAVPPGYSSPVIVADRIFLTAVEGDTLVTLCLDRRDGHELWRRPAPRPRHDTLDRRNGPASPSPAADGRRVVVFFNDFGVVAYDHAGRETWRAPLGPFDNVYGMGASPILVGDLVVLVCDQVTASFIVAFDAETGAERWRTPRPHALSGHSTPVQLTLPGGSTQILAPGSFQLDAYDARTGAVEWFSNGLPSEMKSGPVLSQDAVFVVGYSSPLNDPGQQPRLPPFPEWLAEHDADHDGRVAKSEADATTQEYFAFVDLDKDGFVSAGEWKTNQAMMAAENGMLAIRPGGRGELGPGSLLWKYTRAVPQLPTPVLYRGVLYMINDGGILTTLDPASGAVLKQGRLRGAVDHYYASPVAGDGKVYFVSRSGTVSVLRAGPEQEQLSVGELEDEVAATPALADGRVYIRTLSALSCFGMGTPATSAP